MTDILAPILTSLNNDAESFFCFTHLVERTPFFTKAGKRVTLHRQVVKKERERGREREDTGQCTNVFSGKCGGGGGGKGEKRERGLSQFIQPLTVYTMSIVHKDQSMTKLSLSSFSLSRFYSRT